MQPGSYSSDERGGKAHSCIISPEYQCTYNEYFDMTMSGQQLVKIFEREPHVIVLRLDIFLTPLSINNSLYLDYFKDYHSADFS